MRNEYVIRVKTPRGLLTEVRVIARSWGEASAQAAAYGTVCGCLSSRSV